MNDEEAKAAKIPRDRDNDYTNTNAARRRDFVSERTGSSLSHVSNYSFEPSVLPGNIENCGATGHSWRARAREFLCSNGDNRRDIGCQL